MISRFSFQVIMCNSVEELHNYVERQQLSSDLNGPIEYNHRQWIEQRTVGLNYISDFPFRHRCIGLTDGRAESW